MTKIYPNSVDMTDAEDLASEKRNVADALANLRKQRHQYWDKKYKYLGGAYFVKAVSTVSDVFLVLVLIALGYLISLYLLPKSHEASNIIYLTCPDTSVTKLVLPESLPPTGAD